MDLQNKLLSTPIDYDILMDCVIEVTDITSLVIATKNVKLFTDCEETDSYILTEIDKENEFVKLQSEKIQEYYDSIGSMDRTLIMNNINFLLRKYDVKISDLEEILELSPGYISRTMNKASEKRLSSEHLWKISKFFNVEMDSLTNKDLSLGLHPIDSFTAFIQKLKARTRNREIVWESVVSGQEYSHSLATIFQQQLLSFKNIDQDSLQNSYNKIRYTPIYSAGYIRETYTLWKDIIQCKTAPLQGLIIIPFYSTSYIDRKGYDFIFVDENYETFTPAFSTLADSSSILTQETTELFNIINDIQSSFKIPESIMAIIKNFTI